MTAKCCKNIRHGPSDRIRTCGILLPKQARYQLRYTRLLSYSIRLVVFSQTTRATNCATPRCVCRGEPGSLIRIPAAGCVKHFDGFYVAEVLSFCSGVYYNGRRREITAIRHHHRPARPFKPLLHLRHDFAGSARMGCGYGAGHCGRLAGSRAVSGFGSLLRFGVCD